jgi:hypothetical protein
MVGIVIVPLVVALSGCGGTEEVVESTRVEPVEETEAPADGLPQGHPPIGEQAQAAPSLPPPPPGAGRGDDALVWDAPSSWIEEPPTSSMRRAQYRAEGPGGPAELVVYYFGPGQGGSPEANVRRWAGQFSIPDGSSPLDAMESEQLDVRGIPVTVMEISGTYGGGAMMGGPRPEPKPDYTMFGAIAEGPDSNWFFKFVGPTATMEEERARFRALIESLRVGG